MKTAENRNLRVIESLREEQKAKIIKIHALQKQVAELTKTKDHQKQSIHSLQLQLKSFGKALYIFLLIPSTSKKAGRHQTQQTGKKQKLLPGTTGKIRTITLKDGNQNPA